MERVSHRRVVVPHRDPRIIWPYLADSIAMEMVEATVRETHEANSIPKNTRF